MSRRTDSSVYMAALIFSAASLTWSLGSCAEDYQRKPLPLLTPSPTTCPAGCLFGLCEADIKTRPDAVIDRLFPKLFYSARELAPGQDCKAIREEKEYDWHCARPKHQRGCKKFWHSPDNDLCCQTCNYMKIPFSMTLMESRDTIVYAVHLFWRTTPQYQAFALGECGAKRDCSGECKEVLNTYKVLVTDVFVYSDEELLEANYWFETVTWPAYCKCS